VRPVLGGCEHGCRGSFDERGARHYPPLVATQARERNGRISPDGRLLVYDADVSGQQEIYLAPMGAELGPVHGVQISVGGGISPLWSLKGDEVFYFSNDFGLMSVKLTGSGLATGAPVSLVGPEVLETLDGGDVMPDGEHFVFIELGKDEGPPTHLNIVQNWTGVLSQPGSGGRYVRRCWYRLPGAEGALMGGDLVGHPTCFPRIS